ncbi:hypothetical protein NL478_27455, partial [Klebsiella pneumoniae]|nr:hypothetical protein [Klebsiella pneumoniae]
MELQMVPARGVATEEGERAAAGRRAPANEVLRRLEAVVAMAAMWRRLWAWLRRIARSFLGS